MPFKDRVKRNQASYQSWKRYPERRKILDRAQTVKRQDRKYWVERNLLTKYGLTLEDYAWMLHKQDGLCALCEQLPGNRGLVVDHCHTTGIIRALLCSPCNSFLGVYENKEWCRLADEYLNG